MTIDLDDTLIEFIKSVRQYQTHKMKEKKETGCNCRHSGQILLYFVEPGHNFVKGRRKLKLRKMLERKNFLSKRQSKFTNDIEIIEMNVETAKNRVSSVAFWDNYHEIFRLFWKISKKNLLW